MSLCMQYKGGLREKANNLLVVERHLNGSYDGLVRVHERHLLEDWRGEQWKGEEKWGENMGKVRGNPTAH